MKRIFLLLIIISISMMSFGQLKLDVIKDGLKVGRTITRTIVANELKTLVGIDTTKTIQEVFTSVNDSLLNHYTKAQSNSLYPLIANADTNAYYNEAQTTVLLNSAKSSNILHDMKKIGLNVNAIPMFSSTCFWGSNNLNDGRANYILIEFKETTTVTGFGYLLTVAGVYTGDGENGIMLLSVDMANGTLTPVANGKTTNNTEFWKGTDNTIVYKPLPSPISIPAGVYAIGQLWNNSALTTSPSLGSFGNIGAFTVNGVKPVAFRTGQSALPTVSETMTTMNLNNPIIGIWTY